MKIKEPMISEPDPYRVHCVCSPSKALPCLTCGAGLSTGPTRDGKPISYDEFWRKGSGPEKAK